MLVTRVRTIKKEEVTIPNVAILTGHTINYSTAVEDQGLILHTTVTIGYDVAWAVVHELLINATLNNVLIEKEPKPFVLQTSLDDFYVSYQLNVYTKNPGKGSIILSDIHQNIQEQFNNANIEILSPHYRAERDGSDITIPKKG
jgi:small-conductance mechanosensitive channel